jgi:hypothetical protein
VTDIVWWLAAAISLGALYLFGLALYRIALNLKSLRANLLKTQALLGELDQLQLQFPEVARATAATADDLVALTSLRINQKRKKALRREQRQRRLIARIEKLEENS